MARLLIAHLDEAYQRLCAGEFDSLENAWKRRLGLLGKQVLVESHDAVYRGRLRKLTWDGLVLEVADGQAVRLLPESVRHLTQT